MARHLSCSECRWWHYHKTPENAERDSEGAVGYCRRFPPARKENGVGAWPITFGEDWCGEYCHKDDMSYQMEQGPHRVS